MEQEERSLKIKIQHGFEELPVSRTLTERRIKRETMKEGKDEGKEEKTEKS